MNRLLWVSFALSTVLHLVLVYLVGELRQGEIEAEEFTHEGVVYLRTTDNVLYDRIEHNPVGVWDPEEEKIMEIEEEEDDEV